MSINLRSNSYEPPIYPLPNKPIINLATAGAGAGAGAPAVTAPVAIWNEKPLTGKFNPGTVAGKNYIP